MVRHLQQEDEISTFHLQRNWREIHRPDPGPSAPTPNCSSEEPAARKDVQGAAAEELWHEEPEGYTPSLCNKPLAVPPHLMVGREALAQ